MQNISSVLFHQYLSGEQWKKQETVQLIEQLVNTASPSGYTSAILKNIGEFLKSNDIPYVRTNKGAIVATFQGKNDEEHRLLTAHVDTLGAIVKEVLIWR